MPGPLSAARIRAQRFWHRDGLMEIACGIVQVLSSGWLLVSAPGNNRSSWYVAAIAIYQLVFLALAIVAPRVMASVRGRVTYPRIGYVQRPKRRFEAVIIVTLATVASVLALRYVGRTGSWDPAHWIRCVPAVSGLAVGALLIYVSVSQRLPRFLVVGVFSIILGLVASIEYPLRLATILYSAGVGVALLCSGGVTLWSYLRITSPAAHEA
jgi:hypothetical protein